MPKEPKKTARKQQEQQRELEEEFNNLSRVLQQQSWHTVDGDNQSYSRELGYNYENLRLLERAEDGRRRRLGLVNPYPLGKHMSLSRPHTDKEEARYHRDQDNEVQLANLRRRLERQGRGEKGLLRLPPPHRLKNTSDHSKSKVPIVLPISGSEADDKNFGGLGQHGEEALHSMVLDGPHGEYDFGYPNRGGRRKSRKSRKSRKKNRKRRRRTRRRR